MSLAPWVSRLFSPPTSGPPQPQNLQFTTSQNGNTSHPERIRHENTSAIMLEDTEEDYGHHSNAKRHPYLHCMLAGGIGGTTGDLLMHSLDTVKTRQQGDPHIPPKYTSLSSSYIKIFRQEGLRRGLYGGVFPAFLGSFPGTLIFFGTYEYSKRKLIDAGANDSLSYLTAGFVADLAASTVYVPSEVLKTRLQLQGRYNNPFFSSGYNYKSTLDATRTIVRTEGFPALFYGYRATLWRDLPFSALQFAFYEQNQKWAREYVGGRNIGLGLEILTGAAAGGLAGIITCPLDVVKTRIQTQITPPDAQPVNAMKISPSPASLSSKPGVAPLDTSSILTGLKLIFKTEGVAGWFRGVAPRFVWTSVQSGTMLVMYQTLLRQLEKYPLVQEGPVVN